MKTKKKTKVLIIILVFVLVIFGGGALFIGLGLNMKTAVIKNIDFSKLPDGTYTGKLTGSRFANTAEVTVSSGKVTDIKLVKDMVVVIPNTSSTIFKEVIDNQSLDVDCVTGATVSSKAYLKSLEDALNGKQ